MRFAITFLFDLTEFRLPKLEVFRSGIFIDLVIFSISVVDLNVVQEFIEEEKVAIEYK